MTVQKMIDKLSKFPPDTKIVLRFRDGDLTEPRLYGTKVLVVKDDGFDTYYDKKTNKDDFDEIEECDITEENVVMLEDAST
jgi:hypothetical protein